MHAYLYISRSNEVKLFSNRAFKKSSLGYKYYIVFLYAIQKKKNFALICAKINSFTTVFLLYVGSNLKHINSNSYPQELSVGNEI
jgi:hypothetical protein